MIRWLSVKLEHIKKVCRTAYYKRLFGSFGSNSLISGRIKVHNPENIELGSNCKINEACILNGRTKLVIEDGVHISPGVIINTGYLVKSG